MYADVFGNMCFEALARVYKLLFFSVGTFGGLAPQYQKAGYAAAHPYRSDYLFSFFLLLLACQLFPPESEDPF